MKKIILNEKQEDILLNSLNKPDLQEKSEEERLNELSSFLEIIVERISDIESQVLEIKEYIDNDEYAKTNSQKFKLFFDDINNLNELTTHIYDNMPYEY